MGCDTHGRRWHWLLGWPVAVRGTCGGLCDAGYHSCWWRLWLSVGLEVSGVAKGRRADPAPASASPSSLLSLLPPAQNSPEISNCAFRSALPNCSVSLPGWRQS